MARSESGDDSRTIAVRVVSLRYAGPETLLFELEALGSEPLPEAAPGAHIDVRISSDLVRQYSLITPFSTSSTYVVAIRREAQGRGGSKRMHDDIRPGTALEISLPRNHFVLNEQARKTVLIAGGIGITPIYSMFVRLLELNRDVELHYWCSSAENALFRAALDESPYARLHYGRPVGSGIQERATLASVLNAIANDVEIYCCGPQRMLDDFAHLTRDRQQANLHVERFAAAPLAPAASEQRTFTIVLQRSGGCVEVAEGETILAALLRANVDVPYSCEEGVRGACETRVLAGRPVHRDAVRTAHEHDRCSTMMVCCSGSGSPTLTLDL